MKKTINLVVLLIISMFILTGCEEEQKQIENNAGGVIDNVQIDNTTKGHKVCTRSANAGSNAEVELNYDVYYTGENINILVSKEKLITEDQDMLKQYEDAYKQIGSYYKELQYYNQKVTRTNNSVLNEITINYDKIDIKQLLAIEGEEDNIIENGKAKVDLYIALLKKFGGKCEDV